MAARSVGATPYVVDSVTSRDGTTIGYRRTGTGPAVVLVHGGMQASQNFMKLASLLAGSFTVCVPDRRGRGLSGAPGDGYSLGTECDDLQAIMRHTGARDVFGLSSGAVICLEAALRLPEVERVALYEPPLPVGGFSPAFWLEDYDAEMAKGDVGAALVTVLKGTRSSRLFDLVPRALIVPVMRHATRAADVSKVEGDDVHPLSLIPTMHYDALLVRAMEGRLEEFRNVSADVLLLGGSRSPAYLHRALDALAGVLPRCRRVELRGVGHLAADDSGKPELVARELRRFFPAG